MHHPLVSIIVPVYNVEKYIRECVDSILAQSYKYIEVILVDDGSPDNSPAICDEYAKNDSRVRVFHKENGGQSDARNVGLDNAQGEYVNFCDSDDIIDPHTIESAIDIMQRSGADIVGFESITFLEDVSKGTSIYHSDIQEQELTALEFVNGLLFRKIDSSVCNKMFSQKTIGSKRFIKGRYNEDILFLCELIEDCKLIVQTNTPHYKYRINQLSTTHVFSVKSLDPLKNVEVITNCIMKSFPECAPALFVYNTSAIKSVATGIVRNKKMNETPYKESYMWSKRYLKKNYLMILKSRYFDIRFKIASTIIIIL